MSTESSDYTAQLRWNGQDIDISESQQIDIVNEQLVVIRDANFSIFDGISSCSDRSTCASETLTARVKYRDWGWSAFEAVGDFVRVANSASEQGMKPLEDQIVIAYGVGLGSSTPSLDKILSVSVYPPA